MDPAKFQVLGLERLESWKLVTEKPYAKSATESDGAEMGR